MNVDLKYAGSMIKQLRKEAGYTQEAFADELNMDRSGVAKIESGTRRCSIDVYFEISELLDVSIEYIFQGHEFIPKKKRNFILEAINQIIKILESIKKLL